MNSIPLLSIPGLGDELEALAACVRRGVVAVRSRAGGGSGTAWRSDGVIVTNSHVVPTDEANVVLHDHRELKARVVARDTGRDLAVLRVDAVLEPLEVASGAARPGQLVFAVGNPWGFRGVVTAGIVHNAGHATGEGPALLDGSIRADLDLAPGNSGGPLVDAAGRVLGINAMIVGGMAVALPAAMAQALVESGSPPRGFLGITAQPVPVPAAVAASYGEAGLLLTDIERGSPAEAAGLLPGDILLAVDGARGDLRLVAAGLKGMRPGASLQFELLRGGVLRQLDVVPGAVAA